jgi:hypothetical protein
MKKYLFYLIGIVLMLVSFVFSDKVFAANPDCIGSYCVDTEVVCYEHMAVVQDYITPGLVGAPNITCTETHEVVRSGAYNYNITNQPGELGIYNSIRCRGYGPLDGLSIFDSSSCYIKAGDVRAGIDGPSSISSNDSNVSFTFSARYTNLSLDSSANLSYEFNGGGLTASTEGQARGAKVETKGVGGCPADPTNCKYGGRTCCNFAPSCHDPVCYQSGSGYFCYNYSTSQYDRMGSCSLDCNKTYNLSSTATSFGNLYSRTARKNVYYSCPPPQHIPIDGDCGRAAQDYTCNETWFDGSFCDSGNLNSTPSFPTPGNTSNWRCLGTDGGGDQACDASRSYCSCTGSIPANASRHDSEEESQITANTSWRYSNRDTSRKCQYECDSGYSWNGSSCAQVYSLSTGVNPSGAGGASTSGLTSYSSDGGYTTVYVSWINSDYTFKGWDTDGNYSTIEYAGGTPAQSYALNLNHNRNWNVTAVFQLIPKTTIGGIVTRNDGSGVAGVAVLGFPVAVGNTTTDVSGRWSRTLVVGTYHAIRIVTPVGGLTVKGTNNTVCWTNSSTYEWQVAGQNNYTGNCSLINNPASWDLAAGSENSFDFAIHFAECGDGNKEGIEACDDGLNNGPCPMACSSGCSLNTCISGECNSNVAKAYDCNAGGYSAGSPCSVGIPNPNPIPSFPDAGQESNWTCTNDGLPPVPCVALRRLCGQTNWTEE